MIFFTTDYHFGHANIMFPPLTESVRNERLHEKSILPLQSINKGTSGK